MYEWVNSFYFKQKNKTVIIVKLFLSLPQQFAKRSYCVSIFTKNCLPLAQSIRANKKL